MKNAVDTLMAFSQYMTLAIFSEKEDEAKFFAYRARGVFASVDYALLHKYKHRQIDTTSARAVAWFWALREYYRGNKKKFSHISEVIQNG